MVWSRTIGRENKAVKHREIEAKLLANWNGRCSDTFIWTIIWNSFLNRIRRQSQSAQITTILQSLQKTITELQHLNIRTSNCDHCTGYVLNTESSLNHPRSFHVNRHCHPAYNYFVFLSLSGSDIFHSLIWCLIPCLPQQNSSCDIAYCIVGYRV